MKEKLGLVLAIARKFAVMRLIRNPYKRPVLRQSAGVSWSDSSLRWAPLDTSSRYASPILSPLLNRERSGARCALITRALL